MKKSVTTLASLLSLFAVLTAKVHAQTDYKLTARVNDYANVLTDGNKNQLEQKLASFESESSNQLAILTIDSLDGESIETFAVRTFESWKLGQQGKDNGALIILAVKDREIRIEVGYGLEGTLTDLVSADIIRKDMGPRFKNADYYGGFDAATDRIIGRIKSAASGTANRSAGVQTTPPSGISRQGALAFMWILGLILVFVVTLAISTTYKVIPPFANGVGWMIVTGLAMGWVWAIPALLIGLLVGYILRDAGKKLAQSDGSGYTPVYPTVHMPSSGSYTSSSSSAEPSHSSSDRSSSKSSRRSSPSSPRRSSGSSFGGFGGGGFSGGGGRSGGGGASGKF